MPITTQNPIHLAHPEIPYNQFGVQLAISPRFDGPVVNGTVAMRLIPYRILPDGTLDPRDDLAISENCGDVNEKAQADPTFAEAMTQVLNAVATYAASKHY